MSEKRHGTLEQVRLDKFVHGGQVIAQAPSGKKLFVWGGLPGELVDVRITKKKKSYLEGIVTSVIEPSSDRIEPKEPLSYLSTSPWQILDYDLENKEKQVILSDTFKQEGLEFDWGDFKSSSGTLGYRNKMEFGFWGDDNGLHLAHFVRGSHGKQMVEGSALAQESINVCARGVRDELSRLEVWGGKLKTVVLRSSRDLDVVGALFVKEKLDLGDFKLPKGLKGLDVYYSDPQSPASVPTKKIYSFGDITLVDSIIGVNITYDVLSFFQVNLPMFEQVLARIDHVTKDLPKVDMYSGVGTIGIPLGMTNVLVDSDESNIKMAKLNAKGTSIKVVHATLETALNYINSENVLIIDPPRAGLHKNVVERILEVLPPKIVYLSCNPSTQARDVAYLREKYTVKVAEGYNFFPRTPHIESLLVLELA